MYKFVGSNNRDTHHKKYKMGIFTVLGVEIARAIKRKKEDKTMTPDQLFARDNPIDVRDRENFLKHIDIFIKNNERKWTIECLIDEYINHYSKDNEIQKRIELITEMEDE